VREPIVEFDLFRNGPSWVAVVLCALGTGLTWGYVRDVEDSSPGEPQHRMHHRRFHL
jgi:hypothetical protein